MTDDEQYAAKLKPYLDAGVAELKPGVAYRLQQARAAALARLAGEAETAGGGSLVGAHTFAGAAGGMFGERPRAERPRYAKARIWIALLLVVAAILGWQQWTAWTEIEALEDLDVQLLTSDLPIDAYLDRGFQLWLKNPGSE